MPEAPAGSDLPAAPPPLALACPGVPQDAADGGDAEGTQGRIDTNPIREELEAHERGIAACYESHSLPDRRSGRVSVRFVIAPDGRVARAEVHDDTLDIPDVARCLLGEVCGLRFPAPGRDSVTVTYPFIFDGPGL